MSEKRATVQIVSIGDELLIGQVVNTNASWMATLLTEKGFHVLKIITISDKSEEIFSILEEVSGRSDIVLITGGLGPTKDDTTKDVICRYFSSKLVFSEEVFSNIERLFYKRGISVSETNRKQAEFPDKATIIPNSIGTAPGLWLEQNNTLFVFMPGVPFEMKEMMGSKLIPLLSEKFHPDTFIFRTIHIQGIPESSLSDMLEKWERGLVSENLSLAYLPQPGILRLRISGTGSDKALLETKIQNKIEKLLKIIPDDIFGYDNDSLESVIGKLLMDRSATVSLAESCTGGYISHLMTSVPGSSKYFLGSLIAYSNEIKINELGIDKRIFRKEGAVSKEVVEQMATGILRKTGSDYSVATSGIAGPDGGSAEKPVGTIWIAVASHSGVFSQKYIFGKMRDVNIKRATATALNMLRKVILQVPGYNSGSEI
ncbi:MAG TPA: competence/damage-inducible protein A [Bacteroidales bacterium]|nr:MAG: hypothetical protein A2X01_00665 [Bacteroidetes bacterium GWF2_35_48]OFY96609.1 MAG: hypothetical protein A2491_03020 [Bacteroidetes bacterium RIFOXYC12_FULL_35_7]HBX50745.1 competence/damage-inducible protein A [Bacteroidales bacterium]